MPCLQADGQNAETMLLIPVSPSFRSANEEIFFFLSREDFLEAEKYQISCRNRWFLSLRDVREFSSLYFLVTILTILLPLVLFSKHFALLGYDPPFCCRGHTQCGSAGSTPCPECFMSSSFFRGQDTLSNVECRKTCTI